MKLSEKVQDAVLDNKRIKCCSSGKLAYSYFLIDVKGVQSLDQHALQACIARYSQCQSQWQKLALG